METRHGTKDNGTWAVGTDEVRTFTLEVAMAWMVVTVEPRRNATRLERDLEPRIELLRKRFPMRQPHPCEYGELMAAHGYEAAPNVGKPPSDIGDTDVWPYWGCAYVSNRKDGKGRVASSLSRFVIRKRA